MHGDWGKNKNSNLETLIGTFNMSFQESMWQYSDHALRMNAVEFEDSGLLLGVEEISREDTGQHLGCDMDSGTTFIHLYG